MLLASRRPLSGNDLRRARERHAKRVRRPEHVARRGVARVGTDDGRTVRRRQGRHVEGLANTVRIELKGIRRTTDENRDVRDLDIRERHETRSRRIDRDALRTNRGVRIVVHVDRAGRSENERSIDREAVALDFDVRVLIRLEKSIPTRRMSTTDLHLVPRCHRSRIHRRMSRGTAHRSRMRCRRRSREFRTPVVTIVVSEFVSEFVTVVTGEFGAEIGGHFLRAEIGAGDGANEDCESGVTESERLGRVVHVVLSVERLREVWN